MTNLISLADLPQIVDQRKEELSSVLFERLVIELFEEDDTLQVVFDESIPSIS